MLVAISLRHLLLLNSTFLEQDFHLNYLSEFPRPPQYDGEDEDDEGEDEPKGQPAGDDGPAKIQQSAEPTMDVDRAKQAETVDPKTGEVEENPPPKAKAARRSGNPQDGSNLFPQGG